MITLLIFTLKSNTTEAKIITYLRASYKIKLDSRFMNRCEKEDNLV